MPKIDDLLLRKIDDCKLLLTLCLSSLSSVSRCLTVTVYPYYLQEVYGRERWASTFSISDKFVRLGSSCLPAGQRLRISCVKRLYLASLPFGTERIILFLLTKLIMFSGVPRKNGAGCENASLSSLLTSHGS